MAAEISDYCTADEGPTLCVHERWLCEFDQDLRPPALRLTTIPAVRECFTRLLDSCFRRDDWDFYTWDPPLDYFGHEGITILVPDFNQIRLEAVSDAGIRMALASRRWPGVLEVADILAQLNEDAEAEAVTLPQAQPASLADQLLALDRGADFLVTMTDLVAELASKFGVTTNTQSLQMRVRKDSEELKLAGVRVEATKDSDPKSRRTLYRVRIAIHPSHPSPELPPGETREG